MSDEPLFNIDVAKPIEWTHPKTAEELRDAMWRGLQNMKREALEPPKRQVTYVHPREFEEYVAAGICDKDGNLL